MKPNLFTYLQLMRVGWVMAREGAFSVIDQSLLPSGPKLLLSVARIFERRNIKKTGAVEKLASALTRLGPSYVKLGQILATRPDIVGPKMAAHLKQLQDRLEPFEQSTALEIVKNALGPKGQQIIESLSDPIAAASIAQVHHATLKDDKGVTQKVAVKILRPKIKEQFLNDLKGMKLVAIWALRLSPDAKRLRPIEVVDTIARSTRMEMDFRFEAAAMSQMKDNTAQDSSFYVPTIYWDHLSNDVLVTEWINDTKLSEPAAIDASGVNKKQLAANIMIQFLTHTVRDGYFHADMHPGNLFTNNEGKITAVDFGIMGQLAFAERQFLARVLHGFITRNYKDIARAHFDIGYVPNTQSEDDFALALRSIGEPLVNRPIHEISMAHLLSLLFEITALFEMKARTELILLQKTMVVVEGVARELDPDINIWTVAEPLMREWAPRLKGPEALLRQMGEKARQTLHHVDKLPDTLDKLNDLLNDAHEKKAQKTPKSLMIAIWVSALSLFGLLILNLLQL